MVSRQAQPRLRGGEEAEGTEHILAELVPGVRLVLRRVPAEREAVLGVVERTFKFGHGRIAQRTSEAEAEGVGSVLNQLLLMVAEDGEGGEVNLDGLYEAEGGGRQWKTTGVSCCVYFERLMRSRRR